MTRLVPIALLFALVVPFGAAYHTPVGRCGSYGQVMLGILQISDGTPEHTVYVDDRNALWGSGLWIYQESNGVFEGSPPTVRFPPQVWYWWENVEIRTGNAEHNLQRGGASLLIPGQNEICVDDPRVTPDTLIF